MDRLNKLLQVAKEQSSKYTVTEESSEAEKLRFELLQKGLSKQECLELQERVNKFLKSDAPESDKQMILGYTESLSMICSAIKNDILK